MKKFILLVALGAIPVALPSAGASANTVTFLCNAPAGHVCQFAVQRQGTPIQFALPAGHKKRVAGVTPHADKYCVCDPGPVTPDCKAPRIDHWCMGSWLDVDSGLNSRNDGGNGSGLARAPSSTDPDRN